MSKRHKRIYKHHTYSSISTQFFSNLQKTTYLDDNDDDNDNNC